MLVKECEFDVGYLARIAQIYVKRVVRVEFVPGAPWRGEATKRGGIDTIRIGAEQNIALMPWTYFHEIAHLILHPPVESSGIVADISEATAAAKAKPNDAILAQIRDNIQRCEDEADALALQLRSDYERRLGSLINNARQRSLGNGARA